MSVTRDSRDGARHGARKHDVFEQIRSTSRRLTLRRSVHSTMMLGRGSIRAVSQRTSAGIEAQRTLSTIPRRRGETVRSVAMFRELVNDFVAQRKADLERQQNASTEMIKRQYAAAAAAEPPQNKEYYLEEMERLATPRQYTSAATTEPPPRPKNTRYYLEEAERLARTAARNRGGGAPPRPRTASANLAAATRKFSSSAPNKPPPMLNVLLYTYVDDMATKRKPFREGHLAHAKKAEDAGAAILGGAFANPIDGAIIVFNADEDYIKSFVEMDPYVASGLVSKWEIKAWTPVVGSLMEGLREKL